MKTVVVGAGGGGIASALLARLNGDEVTLIEAHENLGGCASWFERGEFSFDVGATTLSGLTPSAPLGRLFNLLGSAPKLFRADPGIVFHLSSGKSLRYYQDFEKWMQELERVFPELHHRPFWKKIYGINSQAWGLLDLLNHFPFRRVEDFWEVLKSPGHYHLYPYLLVSTEMMLKWYQLHQKDYLELINGILLISAQAEAPQVPFLIGAMALAYPQETYAPEGGMQGLMNFFEEKAERLGIEVLKNSLVDKISHHAVFMGEKQLQADQIILNVPYWNIPDLFRGAEKEKMLPQYEDAKNAWGAFTMYFGIKAEIHELYQQVHLNHPLVKNYFISFSRPHDFLHAPLDHQAVTISTHVDALNWKKEDKKILQNFIIEDFKKRFELESVRYLTSGSPRTFERYTHRRHGYVGGLPFLYGMNPWRLQGHETPIGYIHQVGDTTFPGQGLVGVVAGAMALRKNLNF